MATTVIYSVDSTDGGATLVIQPRTVNGANGVLRNTDLTLYGNATPNWGERFNENFYRLTESFACEDRTGLVPDEPGVPLNEVDLNDIGLGVNNPLQGQLWFNKTDLGLYYQLTPTADLDTIPASWEKLAIGSDLTALESALDADKVDRAGDLTLTGVHGYPSLFFNEGDGNVNVDPDIRMAGSGLIAADGHFYLNIASTTPPYTTGDFIIAKGAQTAAGSTELFKVQNDGLVLQSIDATVYSGLVSGGTDNSIPNRKYVNDEISTAVAASSFPAGIISPFAGSIAPTNFTFCDGSLKDSIAQPQFAPLYAAIGTTYGGTGANAFNVPNMQGRTPVGIGGGIFTTLGQLVGAETHSLTDSENGPHGHTATVTGSTDAESSHDHYTLGGGNPNSTGASGDNKNVQDKAGYTVAPTTPHSHTITGATVTVNPGGAGAPHNNIQPSIGMNYIISL